MGRIPRRGVHGIEWLRSSWTAECNQIVVPSRYTDHPAVDKGLQLWAALNLSENPHQTLWIRMGLHVLFGLYVQSPTQGALFSLQAYWFVLMVSMDHNWFKMKYAGSPLKTMHYPSVSGRMYLFCWVYHFGDHRISICGITTQDHALSHDWSTRSWSTSRRLYMWFICCIIKMLTWDLWDFDILWAHILRHDSPFLKPCSRVQIYVYLIISWRRFWCSSQDI